MTANVLVIGGKGKTGSHVAAKLASKGINYRITTRSPVVENELAFDWLKPEESSSAFTGIREVYIVAPTNSSDHGVVVPPMLERALQSGVKRFVLLSASSLEAGGPMMGQIHAWLIDNAPEWAVLRPTWFMQNFSQQQHLATICQEGSIYSATKSGKVGFIDARDIAEVAVAALTSSVPWNNDFILTGPESLSYADLASTLGESLTRKISHVNLSVKQLTERFEKLGMDVAYAELLAGMEGVIADGSEDRVTQHVEKLTGFKPTNFKDFVLRERQCWN